MIRRTTLLIALLLLAACGRKPAPFPVPTSEMPDSPGLISGPTGDMTLLKR